MKTQSFQLLVPLGLARTQSCQLPMPSGEGPVISGPRGTADDSVIAAPDTLGTGEDLLISASRTCPWAKQTPDHFSSWYAWDWVQQNDLILASH